MSWSELAAKKSHHLGGRPDEPYFSQAELQAAMQIATQAEQLAKNLPARKSSLRKELHAGSSGSTSAAADAVVGTAPKADEKSSSNNQ